jgi:hypothetical protein
MSSPGGHNPRTPEASTPSTPATELSTGLPGPVPTYHSVVRTVATIAPQAEEFPPAQVVGDFLIHSILGRGGMATVYLAEQRSTGRLVALKVSANRGTEARTLASLQHPNIVQVYTETIDVAHDRRLLCMQLVPGTTLERVLQALKPQGTTWTGADLLRTIDQLSTLPAVFDTDAARDRTELEHCGHAEAACWLIRKMAVALAHAHHQNVLHRDVKPGNVLLDRYGRPMLADFNVSLDPQRKAGARGEIFGGTLDYMAPEHIDAFNPIKGVGPEVVDHRSDIYGLGLILFELLTGDLPFTPAASVATTPETLTRLAGERREICLEKVCSAIDDEALSAVILRCLDPDPARRYADATALAQDLDDCRQRERLLAALPKMGAAGQWLQAYPVYGLATLALIPHAIGSVVSIAYNGVRIVGDLSEYQKWLFYAVLVPCYNTLVWCIALVYIYFVTRPWLKLTFARARGERIDGARFAAVRRSVLGLPLRTAIVSLMCWMPGALFFPSMLRLLGDGPVQPYTFLKFAFSFVLSCTISLTYSVIGVRFAVLRVLYPDLLVQTNGLTETTRREVSLKWHHLPALLAGLIPLAGAVILVVLGEQELDLPYRVLLVSLIGLGMLGFMLALSVQEFLDRTILVLRREATEENGH